MMKMIVTVPMDTSTEPAILLPRTGRKSLK